MFEANSYGLPFGDMMNFTFGEVKEYIEFHRKLHQKELQEKAVTAYHQAIVTAKIIFGEKVGEVFEEFPYWTDDEILDYRAQQAIEYFENIVNDD